MIANLKEREIITTALQSMYENAVRVKAKDVKPGTLVIAKFVEELDEDTYIDYVLMIPFRVNKKSVRTAIPDDTNIFADSGVLKPDDEVVVVQVATPIYPRKEVAPQDVEDAEKYRIIKALVAADRLTLVKMAGDALDSAVSKLGEVL